MIHMAGRKKVMIKTRPWLDRLHHGLTMALLGGLISTCAPSHMVPPANQFHSSFSHQVLQAAFEGLLDYHIQESDPRQLALWSLDGLETLDIGLQIDTEDDRLVMRQSDGTVSYLALPIENETDTWVTATVEAIVLARENSKALSELGGEKITDAMLSSTLQHFDRFSRYKNAASANNSRAARSGFTGIGVSIEKSPNGVRIIAVYDDGPAAKVGLKIGDILRSVDGVDVRQASPQEVATLVRGRKGTAVRLDLLRGSQLMTFDIIRQRVILQSVKVTREDGFTLVRLSSFNNGTTEALRKALRNDRQNGKTLGLILDLRGNRGGLLNQAVDVSDVFLDHGKILVTDGRNFRADQQFIAEDDSLAYGVPMVVIVNQKSASAAEVLAAALQDNNRALLIGSRTYGKGTVQTVIRLPDGGEMTVTWARMFAPSGYALSTFGVYPDLCTIDLADPGGNDRSTIRQAQKRAASLLAQRRKSAALSDNDRQTLLQSCAPKEPKNPEIDADLQTAKAILGTPNLALLPTN